ncbi:hypothetical protein C5167_024818 [Papaver somniferum]|uniref:Small ribosomal subunit protein uS7 domain-containing protein n=1 Tax=Papaver somniferum TaxID=3469 RepID=A0A4Y7JPL8_PAPSO|nr:uncharacterized protein LOC113283721 [Papaver somniferum]RZC63053.1 hypothetical protein C5167_024818 [Papaver somniferum]
MARRILNEAMSKIVNGQRRNGVTSSLQPVSGLISSFFNGGRSFVSTPIDVLDQEEAIEPGLLALKDGHSGLPNKKKSASSSKCSEILSYMGGLDGDQNQLIKKLVNFRMKEGQRTKSRAVLYQTFRRLARTERDAIKLLVDAVENVKPICEVKKVGVAGSLYDVPGIVSRDRQQTLAIRWILGEAGSKKGSKKASTEESLSAEILNAYRKRGGARKKRETLHGLASSHRGFAHFRWW